ncbi:hypothetical protein [Marinicauda sp. Alg238-R41]|uniref:hypothetical protein n=1 Tax=Marinicauda sp. Alg238-R41 TaxID=2993447 RepID=UPI0022E56ABF|nr:hypothetical protein [Marinicauda sp. Alg238-R41]
MARCEQCGNDYHSPIEITMKGKSHTYDCFECAIEQLAPRCAKCSTRVIGHGLEADGAVYCCGHCASEAGVQASA